MARPGISKNDVFSAAHHLINQQIEPTIEQVRLQLGTGSNSTIAGYLRAWRASQPQTSDLALDGSLPNELTEVMHNLWQRVLALTNEQIQVVHTECATKLANMEVTLSETQQANAQQLLENQHLQAAKQVLEVNYQQEQATCAELQANLASANHQLNHLNVQLTEKNSRIEELQHLHLQAQANLEHFREAMRLQRLEEQERFSQQIMAAEIALKNARQEIAHVTSALNQQTEQNKQLSHEKAVLAQVNLQIETVSRELQGKYTLLEKAHAASEQRVLHSQQEWQVLQDKHIQQAVLVGELQNQLQVVTEQARSSKEEVERYQESQTVLNQKYGVLAQEKARLEGEIKVLLRTRLAVTTE